MHNVQSFWGLVVPAHGEVTATIEQSPGIERYLHISNVAMGPKCEKGMNVLSVVENGQEVTLCTLAVGSAMQHRCEVILDATVQFKNSGATSLHLSGFMSEMLEVEETSDEGMMGPETDSSDSDEAPMGVPLPHLSKEDAARILSKAKAIAKAEAEAGMGDDDSDDGSDDGEEGSGDSEEGEEGDDDGGILTGRTEVAAGIKRIKPTPAGKAVPASKKAES